MKFAFDYQGVTDSMPGFYSAVMNALKDQGHEVIILTTYGASMRNEIEELLLKHDIQVKGDDIVLLGDNTLKDNTLSKEEYCKKYGFDYAVDDKGSNYKNLSPNNVGVYKIE